MPFTVEVFPEQRLVHLTATGAINFEVARSAMQKVAEALAKHPELGLGILVDVRGTDYTPSSYEVREFANRHNEMTQQWANPSAVVAKGGVRFGMARMMSSLIEVAGGKSAAFTDETEARDWLTHEVHKMRRAT
jgi:hypothetical protein